LSAELEIEKTDIKEKSYRFSLKTIRFVQKMPKDVASDALARQLIRSGTSIGANVEETQSGFTKKDFTYKMSIANKEAGETKYWLRLIRDARLFRDGEVETLVQEADELVRILTAIVKTSASNPGKR